MRHDYPPKPTRFGTLFDYQRNIRYNIVRNRLNGSPGSRAHATTQGISIVTEEQEEPGGGAGAGVVRYIIKSTANDYLRCRTFDGATEGQADVYIAKPKLLRGGATRTVSPGVSGAPLQTEAITPAYSANDEILAAEPTGSTDVNDPFNTEITWEDLNVDARQWALPYRAYDVCVNGVLKKSVIRGGTPY